MKYKVLLVDDDLVNLALVKKKLQDYFPNVSVIGEETSIDGLSDKVNFCNPDFLILDVNIGQRLIFEIFDRLTCHPQVIFISSEPQYALNAYEVGAVDFILKPINVDFFRRAVNRALVRIKNNTLSDFYPNNTVFNFKQHSDFITISSLDKHDILKISDIMYFKAEGKCTFIYLKDGRTICSYKNLGEFNFLSFKKNIFIRVSRSCIVNFDFVTRILKKVGFYCELENGELISVSKRKEDDVKTFLRSYSVI